MFFSSCFLVCAASIQVSPDMHQSPERSESSEHSVDFHSKSIRSHVSLRETDLPDSLGDVPAGVWLSSSSASLESSRTTHPVDVANGMYFLPFELPTPSFVFLFSSLSFLSFLSILLLPVDVIR